MFYKVCDYFQFYVAEGRLLLKVFRSIKAKSRIYLIVRKKIYMLYLYIFFLLINSLVITEEYFIGVGLLCLFLYSILYLDRMTSKFFMNVRFTFFKMYYDLICKSYKSGLFYLKYIENEFYVWQFTRYMDIEIEEDLYYFLFEFHDLAETVCFFYESKISNIFNYLFEFFLTKVTSFLLVVEKIYFLTKFNDLVIKRFDASFIKLKKIKFFLI